MGFNVLLAYYRLKKAFILSLQTNFHDVSFGRKFSFFFIFAHLIIIRRSQVKWVRKVFALSSPNSQSLFGIHNLLLWERDFVDVLQMSRANSISCPLVRNVDCITVDYFITLHYTTFIKIRIQLV